MVRKIQDKPHPVAPAKPARDLTARAEQARAFRLRAERLQAKAEQHRRLRLLGAGAPLPVVEGWC